MHCNYGDIDGIEDIGQVLLNNGLEGSSFFTGDDYDTAIIGYTDDGNIVYSYEKMIEWLVSRDNCSYEDAVEWIDYNVLRLIPFMGDAPPIIVYELVY